MDLFLAFHEAHVSDMWRKASVSSLEAGAVTTRLVYAVGWMSAMWVRLRS